MGGHAGGVFQLHTHIFLSPINYSLLCLLCLFVQRSYNISLNWIHFGLNPQIWRVRPSPIRPSVPGDRVLSLRWPGGLPAQKQAHLSAILRREEPWWQLLHLRRKHSCQPAERVRKTSCTNICIQRCTKSHSVKSFGLDGHEGGRGEQGRTGGFPTETTVCALGELITWQIDRSLTENENDSKSLGCCASLSPSPRPHPYSYVSSGSESDGGYMDMTKDEPSVYVPMQEQIDTIKYADIQPSPYESSYQQDIYQEQGWILASRVSMVTKQ